MAELTTVEITDMNENGVGATRLDGCVVFVDGAVTGDVAEISVTERRKNYALGKIERLITHSPFRQENECPFYHSCGGCTLRHISFDTENQVKRQAVVNAFRRGGLRDVPVGETVFTSPERYRNKAVFHCNQDGEPGYFSEKTNEFVSAIPCALLPEVFNEIAASIGAFHLTGLTGLSLRGGELSREGVPGTLSLMLTFHTKAALQLLHVTGVIPALVKNFPAITGILAQAEGKNTLLYGESTLADTFMGLSFRVSPKGFWQVNHTAAERLAELVLDIVQRCEFDRLIDLYCGSGTFGLVCASRETRAGKTYTGVEINPDSIEDAKENGARNGIHNIDFFCGDAAEFRKTLPEGGRNLVIVDPPRAGCSPAMVRNLLALSPENIVYISCSPNTLARDCAKLREGGYTVTEATPVNLFPRTKHCETVVLLSRKKGEDYVHIAVHTKDFKR